MGFSASKHLYLRVSFTKTLINKKRIEPVTFKREANRPPSTPQLLTSACALILWNCRQTDWIISRQSFILLQDNETLNLKSSVLSALLKTNRNTKTWQQIVITNLLSALWLSLGYVSGSSAVPERAVSPNWFWVINFTFVQPADAELRTEQKEMSTFPVSVWGARPAEENLWGAAGRFWSSPFSF